MLSLFHRRPINRKLRVALLALLALSFCACNTVRAQNANSELQRVVLSDNHRTLAALLTSARFLGHQSPATPVKIGFVLPLRNQDLLTQLNHDLYDPLSPSYHQFLTPQQFDDTFGPSVNDYNAVVDFARSAGFTIVDASPSRDLLVVSGATQTVENVFKVHLNRYLMSNGRVAFCNDVAPTAPQFIADRIVGITGLNSLVPRHHNIHFQSNLDKVLRPITHGVHIGNGPAGGLAPADIKNVYDLAAIPYSGLGQTVALFEIDGYNYSDVLTFAQNYGLPTPNLNNVLVGSFNGLPESVDGEAEAVLDIDMVLSLAPNATIYVYESDGNKDQAADIAAEYQKIADDDIAQEVSTSIGSPETLVGAAGLTAEAAAFAKMRADGQSMFAASGDSGAYDDAAIVGAAKATLSVDDPASQPDVTGVGGTTLSVNTLSSGALSYGSEVVWQGTLALAPFNGGGSGGGVSTLTKEPDYQVNAGITTTSSSLVTTSTTTAATTSTSATTTSTTGGPGPPGGIPQATTVTTKPGVPSSFRQVPDVALDADGASGYDIFVGDLSGWNTVGGTSASAPLWAGFTALVNQNRAVLNVGSIGFLNPPIYKIGPNATAYAATFHDITTGNNLYYLASAGYDDCTGWGTFIGTALMQNLSGAGLSAQGTIKGTVTDNNGKPISGATVTVRAAVSGFLAGQVTTGASGSYTFTGFVGANYLISADDTGYAGQSGPAVIPAGTQSLTVNFVLVSGQAFSAGLQMISAPYDFSGIADFSVLFGIADDPPVGPPVGRDPIFYVWEPLMFEYVKTPTSPADTMHLGVGYWVNFSASTYLHRQGTAAMTGLPYRINLQPGWNMIGNPFAGSVAVTALQVDTINSGTPVAITSSQNKTIALPMYTYGPTDSAYEVVDATKSLKAYSGYWVYAFSAAALVITQPGGPAPPPPPGP